MSRICAVALTLAFPTALLTQQHAHQSDGRVGAVHFRISCAPAVAPAFDRAVAWLHSFEFRESVRGFQEVLAGDSTCAMAWWGIALSRWSNPMVISARSPEQLANGRAAATQAVRLAARASARERAYAGAVAELFAELHENHRARVVAYENAMQRVAAAYPDDTEAQILYAIAIIGAAQPTDKTYASNLKAGAMLETMFAKQPQHPGLAHYIIHGYDVPALAEKAADAAQRYAGIAPAAAHALHMPSHTFTRIGKWQQSVATNLRSRDAAIRDGAIGEALHATDYAVYAYLQMRDDSSARALVDDLPRLVALYDPNVVAGAAPPSAAYFAMAAIPARYALERRAWAEAVALEPGTSPTPFADAVTHFARAIGAARIGDTTTIRASLSELESLQSKLAAANEAYWAGQVEIQKLGAAAWLDFSAGRTDAGIARMREAAIKEDATEKPAVSPGPIAPAREMLADMLMVKGRRSEAIAEYRAALKREPNRYWSLRGAGETAR